jgi:UTP--glucose-1-phosphate uridylyltransferase
MSFNVRRPPVKKAIFPVAGLGTRLLPVTKALPKEMLPVVDKPLIQYAVEEARDAGIEELIFVTGRGKSAIEDHFDAAYALSSQLRERGHTAVASELDALSQLSHYISYVRQPSPLGLGHAVWCARHLIGNEPFAVILPDDLIQSSVPCLKQMMDAYQETGGNWLALMEVAPAQTRRYGIVVPGEINDATVSIRGLIEKPPPEVAPSRLAVVGRYIIEPAVFQHLSAHERGSGGEIQLTDALSAMIGRTSFHGLLFDGVRFDCGDKVGLLAANIAFSMTNPDLRRAIESTLRAYNTNNHHTQRHQDMNREQQHADIR